MSQTNKPKTRVGKYYFFCILVFFFLFPLTLILFSDFAFPPTYSSDNSLKHPRLIDQLLSFNMMQLNLPEQAEWSSVVLDYRLEEAEAIHFIFHHTNNEIQFLRLSRLPEIDSSIITINNGKIVEKHLLSKHIIPISGQILFSKNNKNIEISINTRPTATLVLPVKSEIFEIVLFPPNLNFIPQRVQIREIYSADRTLVPKTTIIGYIRHPLFSAFISLLICVFLFWLGRLKWDVLFFLDNHKPVLMYFVFSDIILCFMAILFHKVFYLGVWPFMPGKLLLQFVSLLPPLVTGIISILVIRMMRHSSKDFLQKWSNKAFPIMLVFLFAIPILTVFVIILTQKDTVSASFDLKSDPTMRILFYGGSSTAGFPFESNWSKAYPVATQRILRRDLDPNMETYNFGTSGKNILYFSKRLENDIRTMHPTHVVINPISNSKGLSMDLFIEKVTYAINVCKQYNVQPYLLLEPSYNFILTANDDGQNVLSRISQVHQLATDLEIALIDPLPIFSDHREEFLFIDDNVHLTMYGHALMARIVAESLLRQKIAN